MNQRDEEIREEKARAKAEADARAEEGQAQGKTWWQRQREQAEADAKAQAGSPSPDAPKLGGFCRAALDAYDARKAQLAAEAQERAEKSRPTADQEVEAHQRNAIAALNALGSDSTPVAVVHAIRYAELAGVTEEAVEEILKAHGFNRARCEALLKALQTAQI